MNESDRRTALGVALAAAVALVLRFALLDARMFHWDEARVGYLTLQFAATGHYEYRPIVHGPFLFLVNRVVFDVFGATDYAARAVVALVGGLFPLTAWLYRDHLDRAETVCFAALLALNPVLLYYSRFMRNDVLVAAFAVATVGLCLRARATGRHGYLYAAAVAFALAFSTKENALLYLFCWLGALAVLLDHYILRARATGGDALQPYVDLLGGLWDAVNRRETPAAERARRRLRVPPAVAERWPPAVVALLVFVVAWIFLFAPRPDVYQPSAYPHLLDDATVGAVRSFLDQWGSGHESSYSSFFVDQGKVLAEAAFVTTLLAVLGFFADRYRERGPRPLVTFAAAWALASLLGYPAITDISGHWSVVHVVVPLALLGGVGGGLLVRRSARAVRAGDTVGVALAVVVLVAAVGQVGVVAAQTSYTNHSDPDNVLVQYGQPAYDVRPALDDTARIAADHEGTDLLFYGSHFNVANEPSIRDTDLPAGNWYNRLPLPWYLARSNVTVDSTTNLAAVNDTAPPVVLAKAEHYQELSETLPGYDARTYRLTSTNTVIVVFVDPAALPEPQARDGTDVHT
ncbi:flippase activity-associated protein Agl23 [Halocalculus aciditolerans]|uniref:TIGR03663 family protein n=1 Tax=Halocalculus aciditolerans TaxID=1383812 RepID=A0A830FCL0_9EURY|nr:flippase activity-associated protein Agl23 [Halocalculus aciditolerans]GGL61246.1 TIGR03663 family protein [Halocalculus aciditolerans]